MSEAQRQTNHRFAHRRAEPARSSAAICSQCSSNFSASFSGFLIVGLTSGVLADWGERAEGVGADILVQPPNSSIFFAFSSAVMQESIVKQIAAVPTVDEESPVVVVVDSGSLNVVYGIDEPTFEGLSKGFQFVSGHKLVNADDVIADDLVAQSRHLHVGDTITLLNHPFHISGIVVHGKGARFFIPMKSAQEIAGAENRVSMVYVRSRGATALPPLRASGYRPHACPTMLCVRCPST